jgi:hypothetical protein
LPGGRYALRRLGGEPQDREGPMAYATGRIGTGGTFFRKHDVESESRTRLLSKYPPPAYLFTSVGLR